MARLRLMGAVVAAGLVPAAATSQYPGYPGLPGIGGMSGAVGGTGGYGYGYGGGGFGGGYGGYPISPFGGGLFSNNGPFAPNAYNRTNQPLSPYLNLLRGGNPAVNYFYGVRPGLPSGQAPGTGFGAPVVGNSQLRTGYLPLAGMPTDGPVEIPVAGQPISLFSAAHPVIYGNRFGPNTGSYPGAGGNRGRPGFFGQQGSNQPTQQGGGSTQGGSGGSGRPGVPQTR